MGSDGSYVHNLAWKIRLAHYALEDEYRRHQTQLKILNSKINTLLKQKEELNIDGA